MNELDFSGKQVLVIEGVPDISNMGGIIATLAAKQGMVGAVVDGGVREAFPR